MSKTKAEIECKLAKLRIRLRKTANPLMVAVTERQIRELQEILDEMRTPMEKAVAEGTRIFSGGKHE